MTPIDAMRYFYLSEKFGVKAALAIERAGDLFDRFVQDEVRLQRARRSAQVVREAICEVVREL